MLSEIVEYAWSCFEVQSVGDRLKWLVVLSIVWNSLKLARLFSKRPINIKVVGKTSVLGEWLTTLDYVFFGAKRVKNNFRKLGHVPFAITALGNYQVLVSSREHIQQLAESPNDVASFHGAMDDRLFFKEFMYGHDPSDDPHNSVPVRAFKVLVRQNLTYLSNAMNDRVREGFEKTLATRPGLLHQRHNVNLGSLTWNITTRLNIQLLFGSELASNEDFVNETNRYARDSSIAMEIARHFPRWAVPYLAKVLMAWSGSMHKIGSQVEELVRSRLDPHEKGKESEHMDCTEWVIAASRNPGKRTQKRIAQQMIGLLYAASHQMPALLTWAIKYLCESPNYVDILRSEIDAAFSSHTGKDPYENLPVLDAFIRETGRLHPLDSLSVQRKLVQPLHLKSPDSIITVPAGNLVAVPQSEIMRDPARYENPEKFDPRRFLPASSDGEGEDRARIKFTDVNWDYPLWGNPRMACPGRWYASYAIKHTLVYLLQNYDLVRMSDRAWHGAPLSFIWTTAIVPSPDLGVEIRARER